MRSSWNPLRSSGAALAPNFLLAAKLVALCLLLTGRVSHLPEPVLWAGLFFAVALLFNRYVRLTSAALGLLILVAGVRSGPFAPGIVSSGVLLLFLAVWPPRLAPRFHPAAIWAVVVLSGAALLLRPDSFFFFLLPTATLAFVRWPSRQWTVLWDGECGFCARSKSCFEAIDFDRLFDWQPFQSGFGRNRGVSDEDARQRMYLFTETETLSGFRAWRKMLLFTPLTYFVLAASIAAARPVAALALAFFAPPAIPLGEAVYRWIARNRHRLAKNACATRGM